MLDVLTALQQAAPAPSLEWPWWYTLLVGLGTFGAAQVWPVVADRIKRERSLASALPRRKSARRRPWSSRRRSTSRSGSPWNTGLRWAAVESHFSRRERSCRAAGGDEGSASDPRPAPDDDRRVAAPAAERRRARLGVGAAVWLNTRGCCDPADLRLGACAGRWTPTGGDDLAALVGTLRARLAYLEDGRSPDSTARSWPTR